MEPQEAIAVGDEAEVFIAFVAHYFWSTFPSWQPTSSLVPSHDQPMSCLIEADIWAWNGSCASFHLLLICARNGLAGTTSLLLKALTTDVEALFNVQPEGIEPDLVFLLHASFFFCTLKLIPVGKFLIYI